MNLQPVVEALRADVRAEAEETIAVAQRDADAAIAAAREEAEGLLAAARADGEAEARAVAATELARARRQAREGVLHARRDAYDRARAAAQAAAARLRDAPQYAELVDALSHVARRQLGDGAVVTRDDDVGGVVASAGSRFVDYRLPAVADRCFAALGPALEDLWAG